MVKKIIIFVGIIVALLLSYSIYHQMSKGFPDLYNIENVVMTLDRGPCYGSCPVYKLTIYGNGTVLYEGGTKTTSISEDKVRQLISEFEKADYFSLKDSYDQRSILGMCHTDDSSATTSIAIGGRKKIVNNYHGCPAPEKLILLENKIDEIVDTSGWI